MVLVAQPRARAAADAVELYPVPRAPRARRLLELAGATLLLLLALPILGAGALLVLLGSGRPAFFGHVRVGRGGRLFRCWKLRTMKPGAELRLLTDDALRARYAHNGYKLPLRDDPRITRVGRILRRSHIDEIPQLLNVLNGTMALVGPRPVIEEELREYGEGAVALLRARPGIVGEWTSRGRKRPGYPERAEIELRYVRTRSLRTDLRILVRSIPVVLRGQGE